MPNIVHEDYAARHARGVKLSAARGLLGVLDDPQPGDAHLTYVGVLRRLYTTIAHEIEQEGSKDHAQL